jgi:hypothetical protein
MPTRKRTWLMVGVVVLFALLACNFPGMSAVNDSGTGPGGIVSGGQPDQGGESAGTQPPSGDVAASPGVPTLSVKSGTGYVFATQQETIPGEDYNIYWNNAEICALGNRSEIVSMGVRADLSAVTQISTQGMTPGALVPTEGEVFAVRIVKGEGFEYALIRFVGYGDDNAIFLEYIYPFQGTVIDGP